MLKIISITLIVLLSSTVHASFLENALKKFEEIDIEYEIFDFNDRRFNRRGLESFRKGDYKQALIEFEKAKDYAPEKAIHFHNIGLTYSKLNSNLLAAKSFEKASFREKDEVKLANINSLLGHSYYQLAINTDGDAHKAKYFEKAKAALNKSLRFSPYKGKIIEYFKLINVAQTTIEDNKKESIGLTFNNRIVTDEKKYQQCLGNIHNELLNTKSNQTNINFGAYFYRLGKISKKYLAFESYELARVLKELEKDDSNFDKLFLLAINRIKNINPKNENEQLILMTEYLNLTFLNWI